MDPAPANWISMIIRWPKIRAALTALIHSQCVGNRTAGHPKSIIMLTADAFGVLPPISRLTPSQAMYHFLSGYTAKVAGTEKGVTEPEATFSTCLARPSCRATRRNMAICCAT